MKIKLFLITILFAGFIALTVKLNGPSFTENEAVTVTEKYSIKEAYQYPIIPGTMEWNNLGSTQKRKEACRVSQDILSNMTTGALVETIVTYPFFTDVNAFDTLDLGIEALSYEFGGVDELLKRNDAYESTLSFINNVCPEYLDLTVEDDWDAFMNNFNQKNKTKFDILHVINASTLLRIITENGKDATRSECTQPQT